MRSLKPGARCSGRPQTWLSSRGPACILLSSNTGRRCWRCRHATVTNLRVYGSMARGDADEHSDVDLLVNASPQVNYLTLDAMSMDAEELLQRRVDVLTDGELLSPLRARILQEAVAL